MANPGPVQVIRHQRVQQKRSGRSVNLMARRNAVVVARDGCVAEMRVDPNRIVLSANATVSNDRWTFNRGHARTEEDTRRRVSLSGIGSPNQD